MLLAQHGYLGVATLGTDYYVSEAGSGSGRSPGDAMSPASFLALPLLDNDRVFFNRGDTFIIGEKDITANNITISAFGSGADPIWRGSSDISGLTWTSIGGDQYTASVASDPNWIWINGICAKNAESARVTVSSRGSTTTAVVPNGTLDVYSSLANSYVVIHEKNWQQSYRRLVSAFNTASDTLTWTGDIDVNNNVDLALYNDVEFLNGNNQWVWQSGTLTVQAAASPSTMNIRAGAYEYGLKTTGTISIDNIEFQEYYIVPVWCNGGNPIIDSCSFHDIRDCGVLIEHKVTAPSITNCTFLRIGNNGITTRLCADMVVSNNVFTDIGMQDNYGWQIWVGDVTYTMSIGSAMAYVVDQSANTIDGSNLTFELNVITNVAYCGLLMGAGTLNTVRYNRVDDYMNRFNDGGGLYFYHFRPTNVPNDQTEIAYNIISNGNGKSISPGIYLDIRNTNHNIHHNSIYNVLWGIFINADNENHTIEDNNIHSTAYCVYFLRDALTSGQLYDTEGYNLNRNVLYAGPGKCIMMDIAAGTSPTWNPYTGGGSNNNTYIKSIATGGALNSLMDTDHHGNNLSLATIQSTFSSDAASVFLPYIGTIHTNYTNASVNVASNSYYKDLAGVTITGNFSVPAYGSTIVGEVQSSNSFVAASTQYIDYGTAADVQFTDTDAYTISFWIKVASAPASTQRILTNQNAGTSRGISVDVLSSGLLQFRATSTVTTNRIIIDTTISVATNAWVHVLCLIPSAKGSSQVHLNGVNRTNITANNLSATTASTDTWRIGAGPTPSIYFDGLVDDVAIWNVVQTGNGVAIYNIGKVCDLREIFPTNLIHYFKMGTAANLADLGTSATLLTATNVNSVSTSTDVP